MLALISAVICAMVMTTWSFHIQTLNHMNSKSSNGNVQQIKTVNQPLVLIIEEKNSKSGTVVMEMIYNESNNRNEEKKKMDYEKYNIETSRSNTQTLQNKEKNIDAKAKTVTVPINRSENSFVKEIEDSKLKTDIILDIQRGPLKNTNTHFLQPNKIFTITEKEKYFYDAIPPFPEILHGKLSKDEVESFKTKPVHFFKDVKSDERPRAHEPQLYSRTIYNTDFDIPFF